MDFRIIKSPSESTKNILRRRMGTGCKTDLDNIGAIGLVQGKLIDMIYASDIADKAVDVTVVESAINEIKLKLKEGKII